METTTTGEQTRHPLVVLVAGAPGSGKSTVGRLLAQKLAAALLDLDTATGPMVAVLSGPQGPSLDDPIFSALTRAARYETLFRLAEDNLAVGRTSVLVAPFTTERRDEAAWAVLESRMRRRGSSLVMVWLRISADEVRRRVDRRGAARDIEKLPGAWPAAADLEPPQVPHLEADALLSPPHIVEGLLMSLPSPRPLSTHRGDIDR
jgi:predicted kinase